MKKILIIILIPFIGFSQYENLENELKKIISFQNKVDNHYDNLLEEYYVKYDEIENVRDKRDSKEMNFKNVEEYYNAYLKLKEIDTPMIVLSFDDNDSFFMKFSKKRWIKKLIKEDGHDSEIKIINKNKLCVSIEDNNKNFKLSSKKLSGKKIEKLFKQIQKKYNYKKLSEEELITITKSQKAVKIFNEITDLKKEIQTLQNEIFKKTDSHIEMAREKDKKSLNNQLEKYDVFLRGEIKRWSKRKKGDKPEIPFFEFNWSLN